MNELELKVYDGFASELGKVLPYTTTSPAPDDVKVGVAQEILKRCDDAFHTESCKTCAAKARICALNFHEQQYAQKAEQAIIREIAAETERKYQEIEEAMLED